MPRTSLRAAALLLAVGFVCPVSADDKTKTPDVLKPVEFQAAFVLAQLPRIVFGANEEGKITKVWVLKTATSGEAGQPSIPPGVKPGVGNLQDTLRRAGNLGRGAPPGRPGMMGGQRTLRNIRSAFLRRGQKPLDLTDKVELVDVAGAERNVILATEALALRMVVVAASFPYKKQVEEFRRRLHLPDHGAVLSKFVRARDGRTWPAFQFRGLVIERAIVDRNGKEGPWERLLGKLDPKEKAARQPFDLEQVYKQLVVQLDPRKRFEKEDPKLELILAASRGLMMKVPAQYQPRKAPKLERRLAKIQETVKKLEKIDTKQVRRLFSGPPFDPFGEPPLKETPPLKEIPLDYCLIRFLDPCIDAGKAYRYRFKVKMANPLSAKGEDLLSEWATVPQTIVTPPDEFVYAVDQAKLQPKQWRRASRPSQNQAVFQIHRWVDSYDSGGDREQGVGDWLVATRVFVERGEYVRTPPTFTLGVPVHRLDNPHLTLDNRLVRRGDRTTQMPVSFGDESILVDSEGGRVVFGRTQDTAATEVLIQRSDGKLIARSSVTDAADPIRKRRYDDYLKRVKEAKEGPERKGAFE
jgi:hypothetical protein